MNFAFVQNARTNVWEFFSQIFGVLVFKNNRMPRNKGLFMEELEMIQWRHYNWLRALGIERKEYFIRKMDYL